MFKEKLNELVAKKNSLVCVGLDSDLDRIPKFLWKEEDPLYIFNREIIRATSDFVTAYKPNIAFYESLGREGWVLLERTLELIPDDVLVIADAKRGDIGNTARKYAETFFKSYDFDAVTVSPYMGFDSVTPFLDFSEKAVFILCLTSNPGSRDFQYIMGETNEPLFLSVARRTVEWNLEYGNCGLVVGATHPEDLGNIREAAPGLPFLIPGVGSQGGNLKMAVQFGTDREGKGALINASRSVIYAAPDKNFADAARKSVLRLNEQINQFRIKY